MTSALIVIFESPVYLFYLDPVAYRVRIDVRQLVVFLCRSGVCSRPSFFLRSPVFARPLLIVAHRGLRGLPRIMLDRAHYRTKAAVGGLVTGFWGGKRGASGAYSGNGDNCSMQLRRRVQTH